MFMVVLARLLFVLLAFIHNSEGIWYVLRLLWKPLLLPTFSPHAHTRPQERADFRIDEPVRATHPRGDVLRLVLLPSRTTP